MQVPARSPPPGAEVPSQTGLRYARPSGALRLSGKALSRQAALAIPSFGKIWAYAYGTLK